MRYHRPLSHIGIHHFGSTTSVQVTALMPPQAKSMSTKTVHATRGSASQE